MEEQKFQRLLRWLRTIEMENRGRVDSVHLENFDLTPDQEKIINDEFGAKHRPLRRTMRPVFEGFDEDF